MATIVFSYDSLAKKLGSITYFAFLSFVIAGTFDGKLARESLVASKFTFFIGGH